MELFGLKTKEGKEYKLIIECDSMHNSWEIDEVEPHVIPEPEFKVGEWVTDDHYKEVFRFASTEKDGRVYDDDSYLKNANYKSLRHATQQEIESHLRKICDEKYIGKKVRCLLGGDERIIDKFEMFNAPEDKLWYMSGNISMCVYERGKFAEIIEEKKCLPKNLEELVRLLYDFRDFDGEGHHTVREFIIKQNFNYEE